MAHLPEIRRGGPVPRHRPESLDLILLARDMRFQWFRSAFARLAATLARLGSELVARPRPGTPMAPERLRLSDRPA
jgi:hypothetical protein